MPHNLSSFDPELAFAIDAEEKRQTETLELIASENIVSPRVREVTASVLTNKYAEGYSANRYSGGCDYVDIAERLAMERATSLFEAEHANVQPHSGSQANMAIYFSVLRPGDTILGMDLSHGGHLTHGSPVNFSGILYKACFYGVSKQTHLIDYDMVRELALKHRPKILVAGASAYPRELDFALFRQIADEAGAMLMVDMAHIAGLVAARLHPNPVPHAHFVSSTTHKTLRGPRGGFILCGREMARKIDPKIFPGVQSGPLCHIIAAKAAAFKEASSQGFRDYARQVVLNADVLARALVNKGYRLITGGTDNHLILVDLSDRGITGKHAQSILELAGITVNKSMVPFDKQGPFVASGIRLGSQTLTSRGMKADDMEQVADFIHRVLAKGKNDSAGADINNEIAAFSRSFPAFEDSICPCIT